jgi:DNA-binding response OmpR family regulator
MPDRLSDLKILVAEPSRHMSDLLTSSLRRIGIKTVVKAFDSAMVEQSLAAGKLDAAIIDFDLRPKSVPELVVGLRRSRGINAHIPVIGITTAIGNRELAEAQRAGVNKILQKPFSATDLKARLLTLLESSPPQQGSAFMEI